MTAGVLQPIIFDACRVLTDPFTPITPGNNSGYTHTVVSFVSPTISAIVVNQCLWSKLTLKQNIVRSRLSKQQVQYEWTPHLSLLHLQ